MENKNLTEKGSLSALLPVGVFLLIFLGAGIITGEFGKVPAIVAFLIALMVGFMQHREIGFQDKIALIAKGVGDENIITMCLIFLAAGAFSGAVSAAGGASSTVHLGLSILPPQVAVMGLMVIGCFISISMGTSMGTIGALAPIAVGISENTGYSLAICVGAVVCGAMFGDNLSMISDTTIAAVRTQGCEMRDKFKENFIIVLPAAILSMGIFWFLTRNGSYAAGETYDYNIWQVLPYVVVLIGALIGFNVFLVLISGTVMSLIVGTATGTIAVSDLFQGVGEGVVSMYDITVISIIVACIVSLVKHYGGITYILNLIRGRCRGKVGGELGIALLSVLVDMATANNTVAIVMAGPIAKEISEEYGISPKRTASLLDIFTAGCQGLIPYGAQLLLAASYTKLTPFEIMPYLFYPILMCISALFFIFLKNRD